VPEPQPVGIEQPDRATGASNIRAASSTMWSNCGFRIGIDDVVPALGLAA